MEPSCPTPLHTGMGDRVVDACVRLPMRGTRLSMHGPRGARHKPGNPHTLAPPAAILTHTEPHPVPQVHNLPWRGESLS